MRDEREEQEAEGGDAKYPDLLLVYQLDRYVSGPLQSIIVNRYNTSVTGRDNRAGQ